MEEVGGGGWLGGGGGEMGVVVVVGAGGGNVCDSGWGASRAKDGNGPCLSTTFVSPFLRHSEESGLCQNKRPVCAE